MSETGLERPQAPSSQGCLNAAAVLGATWWTVYIGRAEFLMGSGWTLALLQSFVNSNLRFLPTYVGQQSGGTLTREQGNSDGADAVVQMSAFGWPPGNPCCLDLECATYWSSPKSAIDYAAGWCTTVRQGGYRTGVYSCPAGLIALASRDGPWLPDFVWLGSLVSASPLMLDPHHAAGLPDALWPRDGQRIWHYAANVDAGNGMLVGLSVADSLCLAGPPDALTAFDAIDNSTDLSRPPIPAYQPLRGEGGTAGLYLAQAALRTNPSYLVQPGDTIASIADKLGTTWRALWALNRDRISNPQVLVPGVVLRI